MCPVVLTQCLRTWGRPFHRNHTALRRSLAHREHRGQNTWTRQIQMRKRGKTESLMALEAHSSCKTVDSKRSGTRWMFITVDYPLKTSTTLSLTVSTPRNHTAHTYFVNIQHTRISFLTLPDSTAAISSSRTHCTPPSRRERSEFNKTLYFPRHRAHQIIIIHTPYYKSK